MITLLLPRLQSIAPKDVILNVTPFVDILFLLIIFFMLASRFVAPEAFDVQVPDSVSQARSVTTQDLTATVTLMRSPAGIITCAIGSEVISAADKTALVEKLSTAIDRRLELLPADRRIVALRIDKHVPYRDTQYILAAVARSQASSIRLAALREKPDRSPR
jgi:biopolymer transport protein ExbD